jgi:hypothetical protein
MVFLCREVATNRGFPLSGEGVTSMTVCCPIVVDFRVAITLSFSA